MILTRAIMLLVWLSLSACGGGGLFTVTPSTSLAPGTTKEFALGSDYPAGLVIPDIDGMRNTAFVVSVDNPPGVVAIDLERAPLMLSSTFLTCRAPAGAGIPTGALVVLAANRLLFLTSSHLVDCDPTTGLVRAASPLLESITLARDYPLSAPFDVQDDGYAESVTHTFELNFPGGLAVQQNRVFISFSNYLMPIGAPVAAPGIVREYALLTTAPYLQVVGKPFVTSAYNPSALKALPDGRVLVVNSGLNAVVDSHTKPLTDAGVDLLDPQTGKTTWLNFGPVALAFSPPAVTRDGARAFVTSASFGELYQIDLRIPEIIHDHTAPITVTSNDEGGDFLTQVALDPNERALYVASFQHSAIYPAAVTGTRVEMLPATMPQPIVVGNAGEVSSANPSGSTTGVGALAIRPGVAGIDYAGPALVALTAYPGKLITVDPVSSASVDVATPATTVTPSNTPTANDDSTGTPTAPTTPAGSEDLAPALSADAPIPCGAKAFADAVVSFLPGIGAGYGSAQYPANVLGAPSGGTATVPNTSPAHILSLGCGGSIILEMNDCWIADGPGADLIVFENAFQYGKSSLFAEPGVVGVSLYGNTFTEFPCQADTAGYPGCAGVHPTLSSPTNGISATDPSMAGGDAFDLSNLGMDRARFVRIRDVSCTTAGGPSAGFDLDSVSVVWGDQM